MLADGIEGLATACHDLVVVGAGPVGLALATDLARRGRRVLVLESGGKTASARSQELAHAELTDPSRHDDMSIAVAHRNAQQRELFYGEVGRHALGEPRIPLGG